MAGWSRHRIASVIASGLLAWPRAAAAQQTPPRDAPAVLQADPASGTISGRVVRRDTDQPVRRVEIAAMPETISSFSAVRSTVTDSEGRYEISGLTGGRYLIKAVRGGYVEGWHGQRLPHDPRDTVELAAGKRADGIDISLLPGAVISGQVLDEHGEPVPGIFVQAFRFRYRNGILSIAPLGTSANPTDDLGEYRIAGLPPGEYFVAARPDQNAADQGFLPTYYPGTAALTEAQPVRVKSAEESAATFAVLPSRLATVSGAVVVDATGALATGARIEFSLKTIGGAIGSSITSPDGRFNLPARPPGDYRIRAVVPSSTGRPATASIDLTLTGEDVSGLVLTPKPDVMVRGRIMFEGASTALPRPSDVRVRGELADDSSRLISINAAVQPDGSFEATVPSGLRWVLRVTAPSGWTTKRILGGRRELTDTAFDLTADLSGVEIVLSRAVDSLTGVVTDGSGVPARLAAVIVLSKDPGKWLPYSRFISRTRSDGSGRFAVGALPAGDYVAIAVDSLEDGEERNPELLRRMLPLGMPLALADGDTRTVKLTLSASP